MRRIFVAYEHGTGEQDRRRGLAAYYEGYEMPTADMFAAPVDVYRYRIVRNVEKDGPVTLLDETFFEDEEFIETLSPSGAATA